MVLIRTYECFLGHGTGGNMVEFGGIAGREFVVYLRYPLGSVGAAVIPHWTVSTHHPNSILFCDTWKSCFLRDNVKGT